MRGWGYGPNSSAKVTHISKQYFILGRLDGSLHAGDQDDKWEGSHPLPPAPMGPSHFELAHLCDHPSGCWLQIFHQLGHSIWQP